MATRVFRADRHALKAAKRVGVTGCDVWPGFECRILGSAGTLRQVGGCNPCDGGLRGVGIVYLKGLARPAAGDEEHSCGNDEDKCNGHFHFLPFQ